MMRPSNILRRLTPARPVLQAASSGAQEGAAPAIPVPSPPAEWYWMQHPLVLERVNMLVSGTTHADAYGRLAEFLRESGRTLPLPRCATLGCGAGELERDLIQRGIAAEVDGYDVSEDALAEARRLAAGRVGLRYHLADLSRPDLPEAQFDAVFTHSALQKMASLEAVLAAIRRALKPGGLLHLNEFVGPSLFQWTDAQIHLVNGFLAALPDRLLQRPSGRKPLLARPAIEEMRVNRSALAARSAEIRDIVAGHFDIVEERPYGGTLLHMGLAGIAQNFDPANAEDVAYLRRFFDLEDQLVSSGALSSDFTVITAVPLPEAHLGQRTAKPAAFGAATMRQLRPPLGFDVPGLSLTVSKLDTMLGDTDAHYLSVGQSPLAVIERALDGEEPRSILDLPCGFGRVTRALRARFPHAAITASDLDRPGVDFSAREFSARGAYSVKDFRELNLNETYDVIWVGSLMTHLPPLQTKHLLSALGRHLSPSGSLFVTMQGPSSIPRFRTVGYGLAPEAASAVVEEYERTGFGYRDYDGGEDLYGVSLTNDHYGISLTDEAWMRSALAECGLRLHAYEVRAWDDHHDVAVARHGHGG